MIWRMLVAATAAMLFAFPAFAAGNVASVDYQKLLREAPQIKVSYNRLKQQYALQAKKIKRQQEHLAGLRRAYRTLGPGTNPLQRASSEQKFDNARKKLGKQQNQYASSLALRRRQLRANFSDVVKADIAGYAKKHGYTLVIRGGVVYAGAATDITDKILAILKRQYRKAQAEAKKSKQ